MAFLLVPLGGGGDEGPPGGVLGEDAGLVPVGADPGRVSDLEAEAAAGEDLGEVELPVEEALAVRDLGGDPQPRETAGGLGDRGRVRETEVECLGVVEAAPGEVVGEASLASAR
ncbi:hypothetical protein MXD62_03625 [Frankia sp. Mgl5]|uniref:hypothetical protein n=1 Tax=Frankia sp. Mgl5 TaxID=2933793 RepID=UPI00200C6491|nr:hypothetical protein [Frankia sp. Mgl5]MCK9926265.1 hypothetical protein [Frankia sp. Mgl5]